MCFTLIPEANNHIVATGALDAPGAWDVFPFASRVRRGPLRSHSAAQEQIVRCRPSSREVPGRSFSRESQGPPETHGGATKKILSRIDVHLVDLPPQASEKAIAARLKTYPKSSSRSWTNGCRPRM